MKKCPFCAEEIQGEAIVCRYCGRDLQITTETKPVIQGGAVLKCPSCGSIMGQPDHTGLVQCAYCGTAITYHPPTEKVERKNIEKFFELCNAAMEGSNYDEAIQYANKILELDPRCVDAWIKKAIATFWLTTAANNRYNEALGYLLKAEQIDGTNPAIEEAKNSLCTMQSNWFLYLGGQEIDNGNKVYQIYARQSSVSDAIADGLLGSPEAKQESQEYYIKAMNYYLLASQYSPDSRAVLQSIRALYNTSRWINWGSQVQSKVAYLNSLEQKENAVSRLPQLRKELEEAEANLAKLEKEKGFLAAIKEEFAANKVNSLKQQIAQFERISQSG